MRECCSCAKRSRRLSAAAVFGLIFLTFAVQGSETISFPEDEDLWTLPQPETLGRRPASLGSIEIRGVGKLSFDSAAVATVRPDLFVDGHFSVLDVLVYLAELGEIDLVYAYDDKAETHVIETLNGLDGWWYDAHYEGGSFDQTVVRMDAFPVKDGMSIVLFLEDPERVAAIHRHFVEEASRRATFGDEIVIPLVTLRSASETVEFADVAVRAHDVRPDVFQPGTVTMLDVLLSLGEEGHLDALGLEWRVSENDIELVDGYYVVSIRSGAFEPVATGQCIMTHQLGGATIQAYLTPHTHTMSHIHLTGDLEVLVAPESVEWLWVCL